MDKYDHTKKCPVCAAGFNDEEHDWIEDILKAIMSISESYTEFLETLEEQDIPERAKFMVLTMFFKSQMEDEEEESPVEARLADIIQGLSLIMGKGDA